MGQCVILLKNNKYSLASQTGCCQPDKQAGDNPVNLFARW